MTDEEFQAQMALSDARLDIANGKQITPERYREVIAGLIAGRESKARALAEAANAKGRARRTGAGRPALIPLDPALFFEAPTPCVDSSTPAVAAGAGGGSDGPRS